MRAPRRRALGVDLPAALGVVGLLAAYLSLATLLPIALAFGYGEPVWPFVVSGAAVGGTGLALHRLMRSDHGVGPREGFLVVALVWLVASVLGALPYLLSGVDDYANPVDALFEGMSGFTTTGATVLVDFEALPRSLAMWRQFTQWLGGMGIIVLALAVLPRLRVGGRQLFESELPGPEIEPLTARIRDTARRLWLLYVALTVLEALVLATLGWTGVDEHMNLFRAVAHAFTTMPTGGFSTEARSIEAFAAATQWVILVFIVLAGANFALMYRAFVRRDARALPRDEEFRLYVTLIAVAAAILAFELAAEGFFAAEGAVRHALFQTVSIMTSTGYASTNYAEWTLLPAIILVGLMFIGGSAGSTSGSIKVVRHLMLGKILRRELDQTVHPELVARVRINGVAVEERTVRAVSSFILLYVGLFAVGALLLFADAARTNLEIGALDAIAVAAAMIGNIGPALGFAGPMGSYEPFSDLSKLLMIGLMWVGRLEIIPVAVLLTRNYWRA